MKQKHVPFKYVYSKLTLYHTLKVDLKWCRSIHHCLLCKVSPGAKAARLSCGAFHHGFCRAATPVVPRQQSAQPKVLADSVVAVNCKEPVPVAVILKPGNVLNQPKVLTSNSITQPKAVQDNRVLQSNIIHRSEVSQDKEIYDNAPIQSEPIYDEIVVSQPNVSVNNVVSQANVNGNNIASQPNINNVVVSPDVGRSGVAIQPHQIARGKSNVTQGDVNHDEAPPIILSSEFVNQRQVAIGDTPRIILGTRPQVIREKEIQDTDASQRKHLKENAEVAKENAKNVPDSSKPVPKTTVGSRTPSIRNNNNNNIQIPKFYFPMGKPLPEDHTESLLQRVAEEFSKFEGGKVYKNQMTVIAKASRLPMYWRTVLFSAAGGDKQGFITIQMYTAMWRKMLLNCHDDASRFTWLLAKQGRRYLEHEDFVPIVQDIVDTHPGLGFLQEAPEFHSRYVNTVIARIFYTVNRSWSSKINVHELRRSNFLQTLALLEDEDDINQITDYFSYEHFYVIYCKFWELDKDHDLLIDQNDLSRHNEHAISSRAIERIFSGAVTRGKNQKEGKMSYPEFVWFLLSEEDKKHPRSVEYWFRVMDLDGDGVISMYEMEYFYEEQMQKMEALGIEKLPFQDALCQMLDLVKPSREGQITLSDLKACKLTNIFFDTFLNLDKFLDHEQKDPFANVRDLELEGPEPSDWEKYAAEEYEALVAEEGAADQDVHYEDDFEPEEEDMLHEVNDPSNMNQRPRPTSPEEDIYDFSPRDLGY
ncbi:serine/threonine-protein phosphatase 2A regulatory subunit B'' subunit beta-like isoform X2 [Liolophura sinensis]|uniref:serine/threonine-protein phosphatase 2A regulatory subunit B'' subunit beta-like isoform X2 n=1 Tax=Liolophura sinensis TaxID=3198878 RepID=UPI0031594784